MKMKRADTDMILSLLWLAVVSALRVLSAEIGLVRELGAFLVAGVASFGMGQLVERYGRDAVLDTAGSLVPGAMALGAVALTGALDCRMLLFPLGVLLLAVPLLIAGRTNSILRSTVLVAAAIMWMLPDYRSEFLVCAGVYFFFTCLWTADDYTPDGHIAIRTAAAILLTASVLVLRGSPADLLRFHGDPVRLALKAAGVLLILLRGILAPNPRFRPAMHLLALAMPGGNCFLFWLLVFLAERDMEDEVPVTDALGEQIEALPVNRQAAQEAMRLMSAAGGDLSIGTWRLVWRKYKEYISHERKALALLTVGRHMRGAEFAVAFMEEVRPASGELWQIYEDRFEAMVAVRPKARLRRLKKRCRKEEARYDGV